MYNSPTSTATAGDNLPDPAGPDPNDRIARPSVVTPATAERPGSARVPAHELPKHRVKGSGATRHLEHTRRFPTLGGAVPLSFSQNTSR